MSRLPCRKPSEWRVSRNYTSGVTYYRVYRIRDMDEVDHSGNRDYYEGYWDTKEEAQQIADSLNQINIMEGK